MKLTREEFMEKINKVGDENKLVKNILLRRGYDDFPEHLKEELHEKAGVKVTVVTEYSTVD